MGSAAREVVVRFALLPEELTALRLHLSQQVGNSNLAVLVREVARTSVPAFDCAQERST